MTHASRPHFSLEALQADQERERALSEQVNQLMNLKAESLILYHAQMNRIKQAAKDHVGYGGFSAAELNEIIIRCEGGLNYNLVEKPVQAAQALSGRIRHTYAAVANRRPDSALPTFKETLLN